MAILNVPRTLASSTSPRESQFNVMRTYLLNFFNGTNLDQDNIGTGSMIYSSLGNPADNSPIKFTSEHGTMYYDSVNDLFRITNTEGDIVFARRDGSTVEDKLRIGDDGVTTLEGEITFNSDVGAQTVDLQWLLSKYRKPRLVYTDDDNITVEENGITSSTTLVLIRDRLCTIVDRTLNFDSEANGYTSGDSGSAVSGYLTGGTRGTDYYYYIYAVLVTQGTDNDGTKAVLVAAVEPPIATGLAFLNTQFGTDKWIYLGCVRNGYSDGTDDNIIVKFVYDECGYVRFHHPTFDGEGMGITLAESTSTANLEYEIVIDNSGRSLPPVATRAVFSGYRELNGMEFHYRHIATDENHAITTACTHNDGLSTLIGCIHLEVPVLDGYKLVCVIGNVESNQRITLVGFMDHYA